MSTKETLRNSIAAAVVAATLLVGACGGDGSAPTSATEVIEAPNNTDEQAANASDATNTDADDHEHEHDDTGGANDDAGDDDASENDKSEQTAESSPNESNSVATVGSAYLSSYTLADQEFGTMVTVTVDGGARTIETNALPDHETGEFPTEGNPNTISAQDLTYTYTTEPFFVGGATEVRTTGVAVNGVKFEPGTAETVRCASGETYRVEALQDIYNLGLDFNNAHVQPTGEYHYHGVSELLVEAYDADDDLVLAGFAADGYLMYYSKSGAYEPSYSLATDLREGSDCTGSGALGGDTVEVEGTTPDGTYTADYVFDQANGDLDSCNGVTIDGQYVYIITDTYPFVGRCLNGDVQSDGPP